VVYIIENNQTEWHFPWPARPATTNLSQRGALLRYSRRSRSMAWTCARQGAGDKAVKMVREGNGPSFSKCSPIATRALDVGSRQVPTQGGSRQGAYEHDPIEQVRGRLLNRALRVRTR